MTAQQFGLFGGAETAGGDGVERDAEISSDRLYRYWLSRIWDRGLPIGLVCMINPSDADSKKDDPTVQNLTKRARRHWRWGGFYVVNLFAYRSSHPEDLAKAIDPVGPENDDHIGRIASMAAEGGGRFVAAWGAYEFSKSERQDIRERPQNVTDFLVSLGEVLCLGRNADRSPAHPLARGKARIPDDAPLLVYASRTRAPEAKQKERPKSVHERAPGNPPPLGSAPIGDCGWCGGTSEGRYACPMPDRTVLPLCDRCGPGHRPTVAEIRAKYA